MVETEFVAEPVFGGYDITLTGHFGDMVGDVGAQCLSTPLRKLGAMHPRRSGVHAARGIHRWGRIRRNARSNGESYREVIERAVDGSRCVRCDRPVSAQEGFRLSWRYGYGELNGMVEYLACRAANGDSEPTRQLTSTSDVLKAQWETLEGGIHPTAIRVGRECGSQRVQMQYKFFAVREPHWLRLDRLSADARSSTDVPELIIVGLRRWWTIRGGKTATGAMPPEQLIVKGDRIWEVYGSDLEPAAGILPRSPWALGLEQLLYVLPQVRGISLNGSDTGELDEIDGRTGSVRRLRMDVRHMTSLIDYSDGVCLNTGLPSI